MDTMNLATELLHEVKMSAKRWFIAFCVMVLIECATIAGFLWYLSLPTEEVTVESDDGNANYIGRDLRGDLYNGESNGKETGSASETQ